MDGIVVVSLSSCAFLTALARTTPPALSRYAEMVANDRTTQYHAEKLSIYTMISHTGDQCPYLSVDFSFARIAFKPPLLFNSSCNILV